jgi:hypothetical protein
MVQKTATGYLGRLTQPPFSRRQRVLQPGERIALFHKLRAMTPPLGDIDVRAAIRRGRDDEFDE